MSYITNVWLLAAQGHSPWGMIEAQRLTPNGNFGESVVAGRTLQCASLRFTLPKLRPAPVLPRGLTCQQSRLRHLLAMWATGTVIVLLFSLLAGCASAPSGNAPRQGPQEVSKTFQACFSESKLPWLVSVVAADKSNTKPLEKLVADFVGGSASDQQRALTYLNDLRLKKYASGEEMAGTHFQACMGRGSAEKFEASRSISCYKEQRLIFALEVLRFDNNVGMAEATPHLIKANPSADGSTESVIRRLAKDTYTILTPGGESAFSEAQFRLCMTSNP